MGFLDSFFGHLVANTINEANKETKKHNELCYQLSDYEIDLNNYLKSVNCGTLYDADWGCIDSGGISSEKRKMDTIRRKVEQYILLGGNPQLIYDLDKIDDCIEKINYLKSKGYLDRQQEFEYQELYWVKNAIESEEEEKVKQHEQKLEEIIGSNINSLSGVEFEKVCQKLVQNMGFKTEITKASGDGGVDLIAYNNQPLLSGKYIIQCKRYTGSVGEPIIRDLYGVITSERANKGILMTTGHFTKSAIAFAEGKPIELIDGVVMQDLFSQYGLLSPLQKNKATGSTNLSKNINLQELFVPIPEEDRLDCIMELNEACTYEYHILKERLETEEYNYSVRSRMIDMMFHVYLTDNRPSCQLAMKQYLYKRCLAQLLREEIAWFYENANSAEIKIQTLKDFYYIYLADIELTQGNMYNAFELYGKALYSKTLEKDRIVCECANDKDDVSEIIFNDALSRIIMNMCQILAVMDLEACAERLRNKYRHLIDYHIYIATLVYNQDPDNYWSKIEYEWYSNSSSPYAFRLTNYEEYFDNPDSNLYDDSYYNNIVVDSTLGTYSELRKINIDEENLLIDDTVCLDYQYILQENKEKLRGLFA